MIESEVEIFLYFDGKAF